MQCLNLRSQTSTRQIQLIFCCKGTWGNYFRLVGWQNVYRVRTSTTKNIDQGVKESEILCLLFPTPTPNKMKWQFLKSYEKFFLFHLKSCCSQDIQIFVFPSFPLSPVSQCSRNWSKINSKVCNVINWLNKNFKTHILFDILKRKVSLILKLCQFIQGVYFVVIVRNFKSFVIVSGICQENLLIYWFSGKCQEF